MKNHRNTFVINKYGHQFRVSVCKPRVVAYLLKNGKRVARSVAQCNMELDTFDAKYGTRLAVKRAFLSYHKQKMRAYKQKIRKLDNFMIMVTDGLNKEMETFQAVAKKSTK